jgi:hypothetical protein
MGKLQAAYWLLVMLPCVISLAAGMAVRIRQKNPRAHIKKKPSAHSPAPPLGSLPAASRDTPDAVRKVFHLC